MIKFSLQFRLLQAILTIGWLFQFGCKAQPADEGISKPPLSARVPTIPKDAGQTPSPDRGAEAKKLFETVRDQANVEYEVGQADRARMITRAPPDFKASAKGKKIAIKLELQKTMMRRGERLYYRLEVKNIGDEEIYWDHYFFKKGGPYSARDWKFLLTTPDGKETQLETESDWERSPCGHDWETIKIPENATREQEEAAIKNWKLNATASSHFGVFLKPGETIRTDPWRHISVKEICRRLSEGLPEKPEFTGRFQELHSYFVFEATGTYRFKAVLDESPYPMPSEGYIEFRMKKGLTREQVLEYRESINKNRMGRFESNSVVFEVVP